MMFSCTTNNAKNVIACWLVEYSLWDKIWEEAWEWG